MIVPLHATIRFLSRFHVSASHGRQGLDLAMNLDDPLPTEHLKGIVRATARDRLRLPVHDVEQVFGSPSHPSPWAWSAIDPDPEWVFTRRHRVQLDPVRHAAQPHHLVHAELAWADTATVTVAWEGDVDDERAERSRQLLELSLRATTALGRWRRRGLGHVQLSVDDPLPEQRVAELLRHAWPDEGGHRDRA